MKTYFLIIDFPIDKRDATKTRWVINACYPGQLKTADYLCNDTVKSLEFYYNNWVDFKVAYNKLKNISIDITITPMFQESDGSYSIMKNIG